MTTIHFVRHGEVYNPDGVFYARLPRYRLSDEGRKQAAAAANHFKDKKLAAIYHSPLLRARQTAAIIAAPHNGVPKHQSQQIIEIHTPYQGGQLAEMDAMNWRIYENVPPEYEQPEDIMKRIQEFAQVVRKRYAEGEVVAVTHGDIVIHAQLWARQLPLTHAARMSIQPYPTTASISTLIFKNGVDQPAFAFHIPY